SWWQDLFSSKPVEQQEPNTEVQPPVDSEEKANQIDTEEGEAVISATIVPTTETPESWWQGIFSNNPSQEPAIAALDETPDESSQATPSDIPTEPEATLAFDDGEPQGTVWENESSQADSEQKKIVNTEDLESFPNLSIEHVTIDTDEVMRQDEVSGDPVLNVLYKEPLNWMSTRSPSTESGTWGDDEAFLAENDEPVVDENDVLIIQDTDALGQETDM
ncbi:MAG: hypothetical protein LLF94_09790, partial [Chlamydiales bacterium]|nr:hypothetical protein [Chlamydiales bacterium]